MPSIKQHRWACPNCNDGRNSPSKLRKVDSRRYCFPCSEEEGSLIERVCKFNEGKKQKSKEKSQNKAERKRKKISETKKEAKEYKKNKWIVEGVNMKDELDRICRYPHAQNILNGNKPSLFIKRSDVVRGCLGRAWGDYHIDLFFQWNHSRFNACTTLCHELAHIIS